MLVRMGFLMLLTILAAMLTACGNDDSVDDPVVDQTSESAVSEPDGDMDEPAADADFADGSADRADSSASQIDISSFDRQVIRSGELHLFVHDVSVAVRHAREAVEDRGGYVDSSTSRALSEDDERSDVTFQVPSDSFENVMDVLRNSSHVSRVDHESTSSEDVTEEYIDLESQLTNLEATEARFVELLNEAIGISEVLDVEGEITRIRGDIEHIQGRLNYLDQRTDYSRIHVSFKQEKDDSVTVAGQTFTPGETAREAWGASLQFVGTVGNALITVVVFFWWGWPLLGLGFLALSQYRKRRMQSQTA